MSHVRTAECGLGLCATYPHLQSLPDVNTSLAQEKHRRRRGGRQPNLLFRTLLALHWRNMAWQFFWTSGEVAIRWGGSKKS